MVELAELVLQLLRHLAESAKLRTSLKIFDRIEEGLDGLHEIFNYARTILGPFCKKFWSSFTGPNLKGTVTLWGHWLRYFLA